MFGSRLWEKGAAAVFFFIGQYWNRDIPFEESTDASWSDTVQSLKQRIPPSEPLQIRWHNPKILQHTISKLKPHKAPGIDGWRAIPLSA